MSKNTSEIIYPFDSRCHKQNTVIRNTRHNSSLLIIVVSDSCLTSQSYTFDCDLLVALQAIWVFKDAFNSAIMNCELVSMINFTCKWVYFVKMPTSVVFLNTVNNGHPDQRSRKKTISHGVKIERDVRTFCQQKKKRRAIIFI